MRGQLISGKFPVGFSVQGSFSPSSSPPFPSLFRKMTQAPGEAGSCQLPPATHTQAQAPTHPNSEHRCTSMSRHIGPGQGHLLRLRSWEVGKGLTHSSLGPHGSPRAEGRVQTRSRWLSSCAPQGPANSLTHLDKLGALGQPAGIQGPPSGELGTDKDRPWAGPSFLGSPSCCMLGGGTHNRWPQPRS